MRIAIFLLFILIVLLLGNIILYKTSEEYRFFVTKIRYQDSVIESQNISLNDSVLTQNERRWLSRNTVENEVQQDELSLSALEFLESISSWRLRSEMNMQNLELLPSELTFQILSYFSEYNLDSINPEEYLFAITPEYPDPFLQWYSSDVRFYSFPTKTYRDIYDIFDVLSFELPITLNPVNNFGSQSFFINMDTWWDDGYIRVVFEYENEAFWLKIKNLHYNTVRDMLIELL